MKKLIAIILMVATCLLAFASCGGAQTDKEYIQSKGKLVVGITEYPPMDYLDADGNWIGFDADMAKLAAEELGVEIEFVVINWKKKTAELQSKNIDLIWNGMTASDDLDEAMDFSVSYAENKQVVVTTAANAGKYTTIEALKTAKIAVEDGSAGDITATETVKGETISRVENQAGALLEVTSGQSEVAIIDQTMAAGLVGEGNYADLVMIDPDTISFNREIFAVGCRTGSDMVAFLNEVFKKYYDNGKMDELVEQYGSVVLNDTALEALD